MAEEKRDSKSMWCTLMGLFIVSATITLIAIKATQTPSLWGIKEWPWGEFTWKYVNVTEISPTTGLIGHAEGYGLSTCMFLIWPFTIAICLVVVVCPCICCWVSCNEKETKVIKGFSSKK
jgi:hypothetical protein